MTTPEGQRTGEPWVIRKRGYFYRANHHGYTSEVCAAGRYSREEAESVGSAGIGATAHPLSEFATGRHPDGEKCFECCEPLSVVCLKCNPDIAETARLAARVKVLEAALEDSNKLLVRAHSRVHALPRSMDTILAQDIEAFRARTTLTHGEGK